MSTIAENSLRKFRREKYYPFHTRIRSEENGVDPDDGNSWMCSACTLPIFSTPFNRINTKHGQLLLHDQCANLPRILMDNAFHPGGPLVLKENWDSSSSQYSCDECSEKCGSMFYQCLEPYCDFRLDLLCSLQIKILHRSHEHRLTAVIRGRAAFRCSACGTQHEGLSSPSYLCTACGVWIHKDCASTPNAIRLVQPQQHQHSLFLTYNILDAFPAPDCKCAFCGERILLYSVGAYFCFKCSYFAHIRCATSDPRCFESDHTRTSEENGVDPDDGNSWMCSACTLPIFSTPFNRINTKHGQLLLHDQCANLPKKLTDNAFHPGAPLMLKENWDSSSSKSCDECGKKCGSMFYQCLDSSCGLRLDLLCSLQIKILHRSHKHRLMAVIRGRDAFKCSACGTQHGGLSPPSYLCTACGFWIHKDCASSPNAIRLVQPQQHHHSLFLTYDINVGYVAAATAGDCKCAVCGKKISRGLGAYICYKCKYYAHIRCATRDPRFFEPVLIRDAKLANLLHLPMPDERTSIVRYMLENGEYEDAGHQLPVIFRHHKEEYGDSDYEEEEVGNPKYGHDQRLHKHPLIFHDEEDSGEADDEDDDDGTGHSSSRVCSACVQFISPPFYSCSQCPDFLLHASCFNLPAKIKHPFHPDHTLSLFTKAPNKDYDVGFFCHGCWIVCSGFAYCCKTCRDFSMDVLCALMPASITHAAHGKTHILHMMLPSYSSGNCSCCNLRLNWRMSYECGNCRHLKLHARCALLPTTITHTFDAHPLKLTTSTRLTLITTDDEHDDTQQICKVCEKDINQMCWNYSCNDCEQWLHINCIPFLDHRFSRVKFGGSVGFKCHDCPLTGVRESTLAGYRCDYCKRKFRYGNYYSEHRAYECSKCCYKIHETCAMSEIP